MQASDDDEDDQDEEYRVFGRMTMKAQSEALYEVTQETGGGVRGTKGKAKKPPPASSAKKNAVPSPIKE